MTPHALTLVGANGTLVVPPSGEIARLAVSRTAKNPVEIDGVTLMVNRPMLGEIAGLPEPEFGVILVVSALVAEKANRGDVMSPGELVRDAAGVIVGARGLCSYAEPSSPASPWDAIFADAKEAATSAAREEYNRVYDEVVRAARATV